MILCQTMPLCRRYLRYTGIALLPLLLGGCLATLPERAKLPDIVWPPPPETPRIALLGIIQRPEDRGISPGFFAKIWQVVVGQKGDEIKSPHGITSDQAGRLYVVDKELRKVHLFDEAAGRYLLFPKEGPPLKAPIDVVVDERRGRVFVSDAEDAAVRIFNLDGTPAGEIRRGQLGRPTGMAIHPQRDELLVVDSEHATVLRFSLADLKPAGMLGHLGKKEGLFNAPTAVAVSSDGSLYVVDTLNHRVQFFTAAGDFIGTFGGAGDGPGFFSRPKGVAIDPDGHIHVVDALFDNIQVFDHEGRLLLAYAGPGSEAGKLWLPSGISIDRTGRIYVADTYNRRVQVFQYLREGELIE